MADTNYATNNPLAVKLWAKRLEAEMLKKCYFGDFMGEGSDNIIQVKTETKKSAGDQVTFGLRMQLTGTGVTGDGVLEGNEEGLTTYTDALVINQLRHAVRSAGKMSEQRVHFSVRTEAKDGLADWWADRLDTALMNQIAGNVSETSIAYTGMNAATAPDSNHVLLANTAAANEAALVAGDQFTLGMLDRAVARAKTMVPMIRPLRKGRKPFYVCFIHPFQTAQLRSQTSNAQWADIQRALLQGGQDQKDNLLLQGGDMIGVYNGVILYESARVPNGLTAGNVPIANVRRAILCGAQAACVGFGQDTPESASPYTWVEKKFDYDNKLGVAAGGIFGVKKTRFNSLDYGTIVLSSYSPQP
ncbi:N4-gp56 family major capsid protein [Rhodovarius lipocyclicus]|uniref:N4-gp56 family major capsid protein n=1 Tax=Rhodovarius lipocyclicus TaxID=268410 RepID=UPI001356CDD4|nr:N4-gp56 family major capsid protein [Rhodovarius lipocyclicus]